VDKPNVVGESKVDKPNVVGESKVDNFVNFYLHEKIAFQNNNFNDVYKEIKNVINLLKKNTVHELKSKNINIYNYIMIKCYEDNKNLFSNNDEITNFFNFIDINSEKNSKIISSTLKIIADLESIVLTIDNLDKMNEVTSSKNKVAMQKNSTISKYILDVYTFNPDTYIDIFEKIFYASSIPIFFKIYDENYNEKILVGYLFTFSKYFYLNTVNAYKYNEILKN
jgi:hypothetical protein